MNQHLHDENVEKIKSIRRRLNLRQDEFAEQIGITRCYLSELETGRKKIQAWVVAKMEKIEAEILLKTTPVEPEILREKPPSWLRPKSLREFKIQQMKQLAGAVEWFEPADQTEAFCEIERIVQHLLAKPGRETAGN